MDRNNAVFLVSETILLFNLFKIRLSEPLSGPLVKLIQLDKNFSNKDAYISIKDNALCEHLFVFEVEATEDANAGGGE